mgnify:CR=1 FL=1
MALKPLRKDNVGSDVAYVLGAAAEKGVVVRILGASGTGKPGDANNTVEVPTNASGFPVGVLMTDVVSLDLSRFPHLASNHRDETTVGRPVKIMTEGYLYTNMVSGAPTPGVSVYYTVGGLVTATNTGSVVVGTFRGVKDADGYIGVNVKVGV